MHKVYKLLNKYNKTYLHKQKNNVLTIKSYSEDFKRQGLYFKVTNDFEYIDFTVLKTSFDNMKAIQNKFFETKEELREYWDVIKYSERHFLLYQSLQPFVSTLKSFQLDDKVYLITYFESLINAYYHHDMLMFENSAYRKYLYDYKKIISTNKEINILALENDFGDIDYFKRNADDYIMYNKSVNRFYIVKDNAKLSFGLSELVSETDVEVIANFILLNDKKSFVNYLVENKLGKKRLIKKLIKMQRKI